MIKFNIAIIVIAILMLAFCLFAISSKTLSSNYPREIIRFVKFLILVFVLPFMLIKLGFYFAEPYAQIMDSKWTGVIMGPSVALYILVSLLGIIIGSILSCYINFKFNLPSD